MIKVREEFHKSISDIMKVDKLNEMILRVSNLDWVKVNLNQHLSDSDFSLLKQEFERQMVEGIVKEDGISPTCLSDVESTIKLHVNYLFNFCKFDGIRSKSYYSVLLKWCKLYEKIADKWFYLFYDCVKVWLDYASVNPINSVAFFARDAIPFWCIAKGIEDGKSLSEKVEYKTEIVDFTRGIMNSIKEKAKKKEDLKKLIKKFMVSNGMETTRVEIIDSGFYGSIILELFKSRVLDNSSSVFFFFSKNPCIRGELTIVSQFINRRKEEIPYHFFIILGNSLEALPKLYKTPEIRDFKSNEVIAEKQDILSIFATFSLYRTLYHRSKTHPLGEIDVLKEIKKLVGEIKRRMDRENILPFSLLVRLPSSVESIEFVKNGVFLLVPPIDSLLK